MKDYLRRRPTLVAILAMGGCLRFAGIFWGMPWNHYQYNFHPDEWTYQLAYYTFPFHLVFQDFLPYPMFVPYALHALSPLGLILSNIVNVLHAILTGHNSEVPWLWALLKLSGRIVVASLGTGSIFLGFVLAKRLYGRVAGIVAAAFLALALYAAQSASIFTPGVPACFLLLVLLLCGERLRARPSLKAYLWAGIATGALIGTYYTDAIAITSILIIHAKLTLGEGGKFRERLRRFFGAGLWLYLGMAFAFFLTIPPSLLLHFSGFLASLHEELWRATRSLSPSHFDPYAWLVLGLKTIELLGPWFAGLMAVALVWNLVNVNVEVLPYLAPPLLSWMVFVNALRPRHMIFLIPFFALWVGRLFQAAWDQKRPFLKITTAALGIVAAGYSLFYNLEVLVSRYRDTRSQASRFLEATVAPQATLGIKCLEGGVKAYRHPNFPEFMWDFPKVSPERYQLIDCLKHPDYLVLSEYTDKYPTTALDSGLLQGDVWPAGETGLWWREEIPSPDLMRLYRELLTGDSREYKLLRRFPGRNVETVFFKVYYAALRLHRVDWAVVRRYFLDPNRFYSFEYSPPEVRIYRRVATEGRNSP